MNLSDIFARIGDTNPHFQGNGWAAICPAHADHEPSLRVAMAEGDRVLLKCRAGCSWEDVLTAMGVSSFADLEPVEDDMDRHASAVNDTGEPVRPADQAKMAVYLNNVAGLTPNIQDYVFRRFGLDAEQVSALKLGFDNGSHSLDFLSPSYHAVPRLVVPFMDFEQVPRGFQSRALEDHRVRWAGPSNPEVGTWSRFAFMPSDVGHEYVVITEGPGDALTSYAAGFDSVGIRGASMAPKVVPDIIANLADRPIVLAGDNDDAGRGFNLALARPLVEAGLSVHALDLPDGIKDLSAWHEERPETFLEEFQAAVAMAPLALAPEAEDGSLELAKLKDLVSDHGLAVFLRDFFEGNVLSSPGLGFFLYEDGRWARDELSRIRVWSHEAADWLTDEAHRLYDETLTRLQRERPGDTVAHEQAEEARGLRLRAAYRLRTTYALDQILTELAAMLNVPATAFDTHHHLLACLNGTVDLRTGTLGPHDRDHLITHRLAVDYSPNAKAPRWSQFLREVFPQATDEMSRYVQRLVGYGITGETSEQCFAVLWGRGANGKSVFTDTLTYVFEPITETTPFSTFEAKTGSSIPNDIAALRGARLVMASEGEQGKEMAESIMKRVTGQDLISARFMRQEFFSFRPTFLILLATNHKPSFRGQDEGLWRRVKLLPWSRYFEPEERDHYLTAKLRDEAEGILAWAVQGAVDWHKHGLEDPLLVRMAVANYREISDALAEFFPGVLEPAGEDEMVKGADAYQLYLEWADENGLANRTWSRQAFYGAMEERGAVRKSKRNVIHLAGVRLVDTEEEPAVHTGADPDSIFGGAR